MVLEDETHLSVPEDRNLKFGERGEISLTEMNRSRIGSLQGSDEM